MSRLGAGTVVFISFSLVAAVVACGGSTSSGVEPDAGAPTRDASGSSGDDDSGNGSSSGGSSGTSGTVPAGEAALVIHRFFLGETDRSGAAGATAWKDYGRDVDGLTTVSSNAADLTKVCKRRSGAPASVHNDGNAGIDNAWGSQIMKLLSPFSSNPSTEWNTQIAGGARTAMISVNGKDGFFVLAEETASTPTFAPTESRKIVAESMNGSTPRALINAGGVTNGIYDSGLIAGEVLVGLGPNLTVPLRAVHVTMKIDASGASAAEGNISGVVETEVLVNAIAKLAGTFSPELCAGSTIDGIKESVRQASDILKDGTQDPNKDCDGISVGLGFEAKAITIGDTAAPVSPPADPCQ